LTSEDRLLGSPSSALKWSLFLRFAGELVKPWSDTVNDWPELYMNGLSVGKQTGMSNNHWHLQSTQGPRLVFNDSLILAEAHIIRAWMRPADCEIAKLVLVVSCNCKFVTRSIEVRPIFLVDLLW
jgi:hypothetical protein